MIARQGKSFATALEVRVVYPPKDEDGSDVKLVDVPRDGKTVGEIVTRGNIVMKEVSWLRSPSAWHPDRPCSISAIQKLRGRRSVAAALIRAI